MHRGWLSVGGLLSALKTPTVGLLVLAFFLATFAFANFEGTLSLWTGAVLGYGDDENSLIFAFVGLVLVLTQGGIYRRMAKTKPEVALAKVGVVSMFAGLASLAAVTAFGRGESFITAWFMTSLAVAVFGFAFVTPSLQALISRRSDPARQGEVLGVNQSFSALARILGPLVGLTVFTVPGTRNVLPYALASALLLIVVGLLPLLDRGAKGGSALRPEAGPH